MYFYRPFHMTEQNQDNQLEPTYSSSVRIWGVVLRTCRKRWTIGRGGARGSGISVLMARQDDDVIKCSHRILIISKQIYSTHSWEANRYYTSGQRIELQHGQLSWNTLWPAIFPGTQIRSGKSCRQWLSVEAAWRGCRRGPTFASRDWDRRFLSFRDPSTQAFTH